jgi:polysaccharide deacetylase family protein (PEP-CTERM system associated)
MSQSCAERAGVQDEPLVMLAVHNVLSVDVEDYFHASALGIPSDQWANQEQRAFGNTLELLEILGETGTKATFFVLGWLAERYPALVKTIAKDGHEIGCHGYSHELVYRQSISEFTEETRRAKGILEDITGTAVLGYRAASFSIVDESRWALDVVAELGFSYDSSIFPIRHDRYGMPGSKPYAHRLELGDGKSIIEFPPTVIDLGPLRLPVAGGGYLRLYPYPFTRWAIRRLNTLGRPAVVYVHPWEIDTAQPRAATGVLTRFRHHVNIDKMRTRLRRLTCDFEFSPMHAIAEKLFPQSGLSSP